MEKRVKAYSFAFILCGGGDSTTTWLPDDVWVMHCGLAGETLSPILFFKKKAWWREGAGVRGIEGERGCHLYISNI